MTTTATPNLNPTFLSAVLRADTLELQMRLETARRHRREIEAQYGRTSREHNGALQQIRIILDTLRTRGA